MDGWKQAADFRQGAQFLGSSNRRPQSYRSVWARHACSTGWKNRIHVGEAKGTNLKDRLESRPYTNNVLTTHASPKCTCTCKCMQLKPTTMQCKIYMQVRYFCFPFLLLLKPAGSSSPYIEAVVLSCWSCCWRTASVLSLLILATRCCDAANFCWVTCRSRSL